MTTDQGQKVKGQGHKMYQQLESYNVTMERRISFKLGENCHRKGQNISVKCMNAICLI